MAKLTRDVVYCDRCGHSHGLGALLAKGVERCERTISIIDIEEWRSIARNGKLNLTEAGRAALASLPQSSAPDRGEG